LPGTVTRKPLGEAIAAYLVNCQHLNENTQRKYRNRLKKLLLPFCITEGVQLVSEVGLEVLDKFRAGRKLAGTTATQELETLRHFYPSARTGDGFRKTRRRKSNRRGTCGPKRWFRTPRLRWLRSSKLPSASASRITNGFGPERPFCCCSTPPFASPTSLSANGAAFRRANC